MDTPGCIWLSLDFFNAETIENWTWFMQQLQKAKGNPPYLSVSADACKGLDNAMKKSSLGRSIENVFGT